MSNEQITIGYIAVHGVSPYEGAFHVGGYAFDTKPRYSCREPIAVIKATEHGDYCGGSVEASNYRVLMANEEIAPYLIELIGSHGYKALSYQAYLGPVPLCEPLQGILEDLENYPLIDDDDHSDLEQELETEAWYSYGARDFVKALAVLMDEVDPDFEHSVDPDFEHSVDIDELDDDWGPDKIRDLWKEGCDHFGINGGSGFQVETGMSVHFYVKEWCEAVSRFVHDNDGERDILIGFLMTFMALTRQCRTQRDDLP